MIGGQLFVSHTMKERYDYATSRLKSGWVSLVGLRTEYLLTRELSVGLDLVPSKLAWRDYDFPWIYYRERALRIGIQPKIYMVGAGGNVAPMGFYFQTGVNLYLRQMEELRANAAPDRGGIRIAAQQVQGFGYAWLSGRIWGDISLQVQNIFGLSSYAAPEALYLNMLSLRLAIGFL